MHVILKKKTCESLVKTIANPIQSSPVQSTSPVQVMHFAFNCTSLLTRPWLNCLLQFGKTDFASDFLWRSSCSILMCNILLTIGCCFVFCSLLSTWFFFFLLLFCYPFIYMYYGLTRNRKVVKRLQMCRGLYSNARNQKF